MRNPCAVVCGAIAACWALACAESGPQGDGLGDLWIANDETTLTGTGQDVPSWEEFKEGARLEVEGATYYRVEGDILIASEDLLYEYYYELYEWPVGKSVVDRNTSGATTVRNVWSSTAKTNLTYCVASASNWGGTDGAARRLFIQTVIDMATRRWEYEADVAFRELQVANCETTGASQVTFAVQGWDSDGAVAFFPSDAAPRRVYWSRAAFGAGTAYAAGNPEGELPTAVHELGHTLGLAHEQGQPGWGSGPVPMPACSVPPANTCACPTLPPAPLEALTGLDYCSVMASWFTNNQGHPVCGITGTWVANNCPSYFTRFVSMTDGIGLRALYGSPRFLQVHVSNQSLFL